MRRFLLPLALVAATAVAVFAAVAAPPARADGLSVGCAGFPTAVDVVATEVVVAAPFAAGEEVSGTATLPPTGSPTTVSLRVNETIVDSTTYPGTVSYVIPATGTYSLQFFVDAGGADWVFSCTLTPEAQITELQGTVTGLGVPAGTTGSLNAKLQSALADLAAGDTADACNSLTAFLNEVSAQAGKKLTQAQADQLTAAATAIQDDLGC